MPQYNAADNFQTTLAAAATSTQTTLDLTSITGAPAYPYLLTLTPAGASPPYASYEVVEVTSLSSGTTVNVTRGVEGTAQAWNAGDAASNGLTAAQFGKLIQPGWMPDWQPVAVQSGWWASAGNTGATGSGGHAIAASGIQLSSGSTSGSSAQWYVNSYFNIPGDGSSGNGVGWRAYLQIATLPAAAGDYAGVLFQAGYVGIRVESTGTYFYNQNAGPASVACSVGITDTNWHEVFMWQTSTETYLYLDGVLVASQPWTQSPSATGWTAQVANGSASTTNVTMNIWAIDQIQGVLS